VADKEEVDSTEESREAPAHPSSAEDAVPGPVTANGSQPLHLRPDDEIPEPDEIVPDEAVSRADDRHQDAQIDDTDRELVAVGAKPREQQAGAKNETAAASRARQKKEKATPRQKQAVDKDRRTGPVTFVKESVSELQKVVYPTGQQLINYFIVVLIFVLFIIAIVSLLDLAFGKAIIAIFS
jgi:preprotein translocase subunit SecE